MHDDIETTENPDGFASHEVGAFGRGQIRLNQSHGARYPNRGASASLPERGYERSPPSIRPKRRNAVSAAITTATPTPR